MASIRFLQKLSKEKQQQRSRYFNNSEAMDKLPKDEFNAELLRAMSEFNPTVEVRIRNVELQVKGQKSKARSDRVCYRCHRIGHFVRDCSLKDVGNVQ